MPAMPRALRNLALTLLVWTGFRIMLLAYPEADIPPATGARRGEMQFAAAGIGQFEPNAALRLSRIVRRDFKAGQNPPVRTGIATLRRTAARLALRVHPAAAAAAQAIPETTIMSPPGPVASEAGTGGARPGSLSVSAWSIYSPDSGALGLAPAGQLGGSQLGFRIQHRLLEPVKAIIVSANVRVSTPLRLSRGKEAGLGIAFRRAGKIPIELVVERRIGIDRSGRDAFAGLVAAGISDLPVGAKFRLNGYAQAGIVGAARRDGFADGSVLLARGLRSVGPVAIEAGGGLWGAVQPGASRLDLGPSVVARFRLGNANVRLGGEWRHRVAGNARPGSGPAITFGLDY